MAVHNPIVSGPASDFPKPSRLVPRDQLMDDKKLISFLIEKATPFGLFNKLSSDKKSFLLSAEIYDVISKLIKTDDGPNNTDSLFCDLFSWEEALQTLGTQKDRKIPAGTPFSIFRSTQVQPLTKLLVTMDEGQGLLDRFLILTPQCFRPAPVERQEAHRRFLHFSTWFWQFMTFTKCQAHISLTNLPYVC